MKELHLTTETKKKKKKKSQHVKNTSNYQETREGIGGCSILRQYQEQNISLSPL